MRTNEELLAGMPADLAGIVADYAEGGEPLAELLARGVNRCACGATIAPYFDLCAVCAVGADQACPHVGTGRWAFTDGAGVVRTVCTACGDITEG